MRWWVVRDIGSGAFVASCRGGDAETRARRWLVACPGRFFLVEE